MWRDRMLLAISFAVFAAYVGNTMIVPVRVLYAEKEGASLGEISAMATAFLVSNFIFQFPMGWIADHFGRKRLMVIGLLAQAVISLLYLAFANPLAFVALRFLEGIASATMLSPARAMIADIVAPAKRGEAYGVFNAFFNASWVLGPGIGSLLASLNYESVFAAAFLTRLIAAGLVFFVLFEPSHAGQQEGTPRRKVAVRELFTLPLVGAYVLVLSDYMYLGFDQTLFPLWMQDHLGATVALIGLTYITWGAPPTLLSPWGGKLADRVRRSTLILALGLAQVPIYIMYGFLDVAWPILILGLLHSSVYALMQPAMDANLAAASVENARARVQGVYSSVGLAAAFASANGLPILYAVDWRLPLFTMAAVFGVLVVIGGLIIRWSEQRGLVAGPGIGENSRKDAAVKEEASYG